MSYGVPSDEVAEDYRKALEDLTMNSRYEISNLTVIAKENTEHALAIAEAVKNHIKQTSPQKKLPAFYVLDSVVKNVGTPYTLFFGRQLYSTFMEAYALVDNSVRRKMDEMLKTWKEPVPGSMDTRPVFPPDVTRPIENALIKARTSAVQAQQEHMRSQAQFMGRGRASVTPYRETPTPPAGYGQQPPAQGYNNYLPQQYPQPNGQGYQAQPPQYQNQQAAYPPNNQPYQNASASVPYQNPQAIPQYQNPPAQNYQSQPPNQIQHALPPRPPSQQYSAPGQYAPPGMAAPGWQQPPPQANPTIDTVVLNRDIEKLITTAKAEWALNEYDMSVRTRLKALLDLQTILQSQTLPHDQIALIKKQVEELSANAQPLRLPDPPIPTAAPVAPQPTLNSLLGPGALQALLARQSATPQPSGPLQGSDPIPPPQNVYPQNAYQQAPTPAPVSTPAADPNSLLERLRAAGMLPGLAAAPNTAAPTIPKLSGFPPPPPPPFLSTPPIAQIPLANIPNDVVLKPSSLKIPRPHLIATLYENLGAPCTQCGRRFPSTPEGRAKKTAHMDWHFRVRQRMEEAEAKGQHRSWYVDELDWIKSREVDGSADTDPNGSSNNSPDSKDKNKKKEIWMPVPDDPVLKGSVCPICQERFEMKWLDEAQEFVWMDAKTVSGRVYHASCYAEAQLDTIKAATPEPASTLGKRKAEDDLAMHLKAKIKMEPIASG